MKILLCILTLSLFGTFAFGDFKENSQAVQFDIGFSQGGMALGAEYEYGIKKTHGVGGYIRILPEEDDPEVSEIGITAIGAFIRPHFNRQSWDLYVSPGFGMYMIDGEDVGKKDKTMLGPSLALGLLYELNPKFSVGVENLRLYGWLGDDIYRGDISDTTLAKFRMIF